MHTGCDDDSDLILAQQNTHQKKQMNPTQLRTMNAAFAAALLREAMSPLYDRFKDRLEHGFVTTANTSLFHQTHFSEPLTTYALGWRDPANYDALSEFIAPPVITNGELFEHIEYPNAEAFMSDVNGDDDLRAINAEFKTVDYTQSKAQRSIPNRGLRMVVDYDRVKNMPNWQETFTNRLLQRISRNAARRKVALALAAGTAASLTWSSGTPDPDLDLANQAKLSGDASGISPNRAIWGLGAKILRFQAYGSQATAGAFGGRSLSIEQAMSALGLLAQVDESRYQAGTAKASILGTKIVLFNAASQSGEDPSNFKTARGTTRQGGRWGVYVREIGAKFTEITVECYEMEWAASVLGVRTITPS